MKPPEFDYAAPTSLAEAVALLAADDDAKVLAGGQSLVPLLAFRLAAPSLLVDLARVPGLDAISVDDGRVTIGAMVRQTRAEHDPVLAASCPLLVDALRHVAHPQIRSRGTIGGSIAHADPAAELPAALLALDGRARVVGTASERTIEAAELFQGYLTTALAPDEILVSVDLPAIPPQSGVACVEVARRAGDYALGGALCQIGLDGAGRIVEARLALLAAADRPVRASAVEAALLEGASPCEASARAAEGIRPVDDVHASAEYRAHLARVVSERAITKALEGAR